MNHIEVLRQLEKEYAEENVATGLREALSHAIKCCEIVEGLPDKNEIEQIINNYCQGVINKDKVMLIYGKVAHAIHERIGGVK